MVHPAVAAFLGEAFLGEAGEPQLLLEYVRHERGLAIGAAPGQH
jgi:hypothetical protein